MQEYVTQAVVLNKEPLRDFDARYAFYTKRFGKVVGKATSSRKITSRLAGHLEPGSVVAVRFVEKNGGNGAAQIVDALKLGRLAASPAHLRSLSGLLVDGDADAALWNELIADRFQWEEILRIMGWDPEGAVCERCGKAAAAFYLPRQDFFCTSCASKASPDALLLLRNAEL